MKRGAEFLDREAISASHQNKALWSARLCVYSESYRFLFI
uniref:Uncharacterized protein n=1 Tax=Arundo donax TaxID=35708 RepID=A0A0A8ZW17_ARUDO